MEPTEIWPFDLARGSSRHPSEGACLIDVVSWVRFGVLDDRPLCVCPVLAAYGRYLNDIFDDVSRQDLKVLISALARSRDPDAAARRSTFIIEDSLRNFALRSANLDLPIGKRVVVEILLRAASLTSAGFAIGIHQTEKSIPLSISPFEANMLSSMTPEECRPFFRDAIRTFQGALRMGRQGSIDPEILRAAQESFRVARISAPAQ